MFKKRIISLIVVWFSFVGVCMWLLFSFSSKGKTDYLRLMIQSDQHKRERLQDNDRSTEQTREQVSKQILYKKGNDRLQTRLIGDESELVYSKKEKELVEYFKGVTCLMQDDLIHPSEGEGSSNNKQMIRQLKSQEAIYTYSQGKLEAKTVAIAHYHLPGHLYPHSLENGSPLFQGTATHLEFSLLKEPNIHAHGFQATLYTNILEN